MGNRSLSRDIDFWIAIGILVLTTIISIPTYLRWINLRFQIGPFYFTHWLTIIGSTFIAVYTPVYYIYKRRYLKQVKTLVRVHVFGNLLSVMLISIHYAQQIGRPEQFYPDLGTGLMLYVVMFILVATGFLTRFGIIQRFGWLSGVLPHQNRFLHIAITFSYYLSILIHSLQNFGII
jgi:hypothetical protein